MANGCGRFSSCNVAVELDDCDLSTVKEDVELEEEEGTSSVAKGPELAAEELKEDRGRDNRVWKFVVHHSSKGDKETTMAFQRLIQFMTLCDTIELLVGIAQYYNCLSRCRCKSTARMQLYHDM